MSWSLQSVGKAPAVRADVAKSFTTNQCTEPEETVRQAAAAVIDAALAAQDPSVAVKVTAQGSQSLKAYTAGTGYSLTGAIEPLWGFVE